MRLRLTSVVNFSILLMLVTALTMYGTEDKKVVLENKFPVQSGERLSVDASSGDIVINTWDKNEVYVKILATSRAAEKMEFEAEKTSYGVKVVAKRKGNFISKMFDWSRISVRIEIALPRNYNPDVSTSGGDIRVKAVNGEIKLRTSGGDVDLFESAGDLRASTSGGDIGINGYKGASVVSTSGGDIKYENSYGDVSASTSGGDINIESKDGKVKASTSGGDIKVVYDGDNKGVNLSTTGGDIDLVLPASIKADVKLNTTGGDVSCALNISKSIKISSSRFEAEINGGGAEIRCTTTGGDVKVKSR